MFDDKVHVPIMAAILVLSGLAQLSPVASADHCESKQDIDQDFDAWLSTTQPAAEQFSASRFLQFFLFPNGGQDVTSGVNTADVTNGVDAYVHDFGCELSGGNDWCIVGIPGSEDGNLGTDSGRLLQFQGRDDDWRVQFFDANGLPTSSDPVEISKEQADKDKKEKDGEWCDPQAQGTTIPADTRYAVVWIDSSEVVNEDGSLDATENLIPRGYKTGLKDNLRVAPQGPPGIYTAKFHFDTCIDQDSGDNDICN